MKANTGMHMTRAIESRERRTMIRLKVFGLSLLMLLLPALGSTASNLSKLAELAATVQPGTFVELEIDGDVSTCEAMAKK